MSPADSSFGAIHDGEDLEEGFGGRRVDWGRGESRERPSGWKSLQLPAGGKRTRKRDQFQQAPWSRVVLNPS